MLPGVDVKDISTAPARTVPLNTGTWFIAGITEQGRIDEPVEIRNMEQYIAEFGDFVSYGTLYNALDVFFREGGSIAQVVRIVGADAEAGTIELPDGEKVSLIATALTPGAWSNGMKIKVVVDGANFNVQVQNSGGETLEESGLVADKTAAIAWAENSSSYIELTDGGEGSGDPDAGTYTLADGDDDREAIVTADLEAAFELLSTDLGPGQVSLPGYTSTAAHEVVLDHADTHDRVAILDLADTGVAATLIAAVAALRDLDGAKHGGAFAPWAIVPGLTANTTRTVPWSCIQAGIFARNDSAGLSPNTAGAAARGESRYAIGLSQSAWVDTVREELNEASVNVVKTVIGNIQTYGNRCIVDPEDEPQFALLSNARLHMVITAKGNAIGAKYVFENIDAKKKTFSRLNGELRAMLGKYHSEDALYGERAEEAFYVDTDSVNTPETIQNKEINATIEVRYSPAGERVQINISRALVTEAV